MKTFQGHELRIPVDEAALRELCVRWKVKTLEVFGSVLREDFEPDRSDVDMLVDFLPGVEKMGFDWSPMEKEMERLVGRHVDLLRRKAVEKHDNPYRRQGILGTAEKVYVSS